jgi:K+-transporting ATPase ATPase A chain
MVRDLFAFGLYGAIVIGLAWPLAAFMRRVYAGEPTFLTPLCGPVEHWTYQLAGVDPQRHQHWTAYALAILAFNLAGFALLYLVLRLQGILPWNPRACHRWRRISPSTRR